MSTKWEKTTFTTKQVKHTRRKLDRSLRLETNTLRRHIKELKLFYINLFSSKLSKIYEQEIEQLLHIPGLGRLTEDAKLKCEKTITVSELRRSLRQNGKWKRLLIFIERCCPK